MIPFDPYWLGLDYMEDSTPGDGNAIVYLPSIVNDSTAAAPQAESEASVHSFMQDNFRLSAMNMMDTGLVINAIG